MISPAGLVKRVGVGGRLVPFFKAVCVYFAVGGATTPVAAAAKCAPVLCLMLLVIFTHGAKEDDQGRYARRVALGLALSALGDVFLVWPQHFVAGMAAFAAAHIAYLTAFRWTPRSPIIALCCYIPTLTYLNLLSPPSQLKTLVPLYAMLLATMAWRALARGLKPKARRTDQSAAAGAILFLLSDAILGYSLFGGTVPYKQVLVMSTYYLGQLGIALSALETPAPAQLTPHVHAQ